MKVHPVSDFVWSRRQPTGLFGRAPGVATGTSGQFAIHRVNPDGSHLLARDPLGVNKLFFAVADGDVHSSNYLIDLIRQGIPAASISSVPAGHSARVLPNGSVELARHGRLEFNDGPGPSLETVAGTIRSALASAFAEIRKLVAGRRVYVTLSGGLDSTVIAALAREWLGEFTAVTFGVTGDAAGPSEDMESAARVASDLGVRHELVLADADDLLGLLDPVLLYGQDWRDFNVHCGIVNAAIGQALSPATADAAPRPVVLTGDTMNELMADYAAVTYGGREYYALPGVPPGQLRRFLVQGLDAGDREVGVLTHFGVDVIQPYAWCADAYAGIPGPWLQLPSAKSDLVRAVLGSVVPPYVYARKKVRAQAGSAVTPAGILALFADRGIGAQYLASRFARLFGLSERELPRLIRGGVYRQPARLRGGRASSLGLA